MTSLKKICQYLVWLEIWPIGGLAVLNLLTDRFLLPAVVAAGFFWPLRRVATGRFTRRTPLDLPNLILIGIGLVSLAVSIAPDVTGVQVLRLFFGILLYYALVNWLDRPGRLSLAADLAALGGLSLALVGPLFTRWFGVKLSFIPAGVYTLFPQPANGIVHPNVLAGSLALLLPLSLGLLAFGWAKLTPLERILHLSAGAGMTVALILTQSRGAWLGSAAALLILLLLRWKRGWVLAVGAGVIVVIAVIWVGLAKAAEFLSNSGSISGAGLRMEIWSRAAAMIQDFPLTGIGMGNFSPVVDWLYPLVSVAPGEVVHAHNLFLQIAVDLGLPGLLAWLAAWIAIWVAIWQTYRRSQSAGARWTAGLAAGLLAGQAALGVHGLLDAVMWGMVRPAILVWVIWGLAIAAANLSISAAQPAQISGKSHEEG
jgi:putative inorganic carbon (HCO3(-)) transporter